LSAPSLPQSLSPHPPRYLISTAEKSHRQNTKPKKSPPTKMKIKNNPPTQNGSQKNSPEKTRHQKRRTLD